MEERKKSPALTSPRRGCGGSPSCSQSLFTHSSLSYAPWWWWWSTLATFATLFSGGGKPLLSSTPLDLVPFLGGGVTLPSYDTKLRNRITEGKDNMADTEATVLITPFV